MRNAVIVDSVRTGLAKSFRGGFNNTRADNMTAHVVNALLERNPKVDASMVEDIILGCGNPEGAQGHNIARNVAVLSDLPIQTGGVTINRYCSSGLNSIAMAATQIQSGFYDCIIAGGVESISTSQGHTNMHMYVNDKLAEEVPGIYHAMGTTAEAVADRYNFSSLRFITCGGSVLPYEVSERAEQQFGAKIIQGYGLMDYGALASHGVDDPEEARWMTNGRPLPGTEISIQNKNGQPLDVGEVGEILARGPHCVGGYVDEPTLTETAWKNGYFHSGDLGRIDTKGYLQVVGRLKDIIIRGGQNISPAEIEGILGQHPKVTEAVAVKMPDPDLGERVCVFVVSAAKEPIDFEDMVQFMLDQGVAKFKIPERLELIDEFPLTPGGTKIDKKSLEDLVR